LYHEMALALLSRGRSHFAVLSASAAALGALLAGERADGRPAQPSTTLISVLAASGRRAEAPVAPVFRAKDVAAHATAASRIWVSYKDGVYDVTDFVAMHPGGSARLMLAAGGPLDPYWAVYTQHSKAFVGDILAQYRIGSLAQEDVVVVAPRESSDASDPYNADPVRSPVLTVRTARPFNGEPPASLLSEAYITPTDLMFVRNHYPVPDVDPSAYRLRVDVPDGKGGRSVSLLTLQELKDRFPRVEVTAALQCAGNRRASMASAKLARGLEWDTSAISNVTWGGARLRDVLAAAGVDVEAGGRDGVLPSGTAAQPPTAHAIFEGLDVDPTAGGRGYSASVPLDIALAPAGDVLLAYDMNDAPLTRDHGFPVRTVVPGVIAARSVKWLSGVSLAPEEDCSIWQRKDYKIFPQNMDWNNTDYEAAPPMMEMAVNSAIGQPAPGPLTVPASASSLPVRGWAWAGGGRAIARVDVSADGGATWTHARVTERPPGATPSGKRSYGWSLWEAAVPLPPTGGSQDVTLAVRALDASGNMQPSDPLQIWNWRGVGNNSWHKVVVHVRRAGV